MKALLVVAAAALGVVTATTRSFAADLRPGAPAPDFALAGSDGKTHRLSDYAGKTVVLAWFPKAFTGG